MANLVRKYQKVFASGAANNGQFGSLQAATKVTSIDPEVIQALAAYESGWNDAIVSGKQLPSLEEFQGLQYKTDYQLAYLLNKGVPEWDDLSEYYIGDIQREVGGTQIYKSITDNNIGNVLTDIVNWELLGDLANLINAGVKSAGDIVQVVNFQTGAVATGTTIMPSDDSVPQNTEGDEYMALTFTPTKASNKLFIQVVFNFAINSGTSGVAALFQDSIVSALAGQLCHTETNATDRPTVICFNYYMTAGSILPTTFKVRSGPATAGTLTFNGSATLRVLGGVEYSSITITEIQV